MFGVAFLVYKHGGKNKLALAADLCPQIIFDSLLRIKVLKESTDSTDLVIHQSLHVGTCFIPIVSFNRKSLGGAMV